MNNTTFNSEFEKLMKAFVEYFGYALETLFTDGKDVKFDSIDKHAYIVPASLLNNADYLTVRQQTMPYAVIAMKDSSEDKKSEFAIVFFDSIKADKGIVKMIDATRFLVEDEDDMLIIANLFYHDAFPGEDKLKFDVCEDEIDDLSDHWDDYVKMISFTVLENNNYSWLPNDYCYDLPLKKGFELKELDAYVVSAHGSLPPQLETRFFSDFGSHRKGTFSGKVVLLKDLKLSQVDYKLTAGDILDREGEGEYYEVKDREVIAVSLSGDLRPTVIDAKGSVIYIPLAEEMAVIDMGKDDFDAEYIVKELQKDYVAKQLENKSHSAILNDRQNTLSLVKIYVPVNADGLSSKERQRMYVQKEQNDYVKYLEEELEKERSKYLKSYREVCDYCKEESLKRLLIKLEKDEISDDFTIFNEVRQLLEWIQKQSPAYLNKYKDISTLNLYSREISNDHQIPEYIKRSFHTCTSLGNRGSHYNKREHSPYLAKSVIYSLLNILYWCKGLDDKK